MNLAAGLMDVGFTEYEARVYLALLRENPATGYHLSKASGVPRSMVYDALGRLEARGAVQKTEDRRATLYRPVAPEVLLDRYAREHQQLLRGLRGGLDALYQTQEEERFWAIKGRGAVLSYVAQLIDSASHELFLVLADPELDALRETIAAACARGVAVSAVLTGQGELTCGQVVRHPPLESQLQELTQMLVAVVDGRQVLIGSTGIETAATTTNNRNVALIARQFVWMELFAHRINARIGPELLERLDPEDRRILESHAHQ